jgi:catechol 2,3-dioxygenase-like lactoylglutathione lyase family enzyme
MKRLHVHVSVENLADSIRFYSGLFASEPTILQTDYAKWQLDDPRVNFAISQRGAAIGLNHLGLQVESADELGEMQKRLQALEPDLEREEGVACCYAKSDKYWVHDPSGIAWETFQTLDAIPVFGEPDKVGGDSVCCVPEAKAVPVTFVKPRIPLNAATSCCAPSTGEHSGASCC